MSDNDDLYITNQNQKVIYKTSKTMKIVAWIALGLGILVLFLVAICWIMLFSGYNQGDAGIKGDKGDPGTPGRQGPPGPIRPYQYGSVSFFNYNSGSNSNNILTFQPGQIVILEGTNTSPDNQELNIRLPNDNSSFQMGDTITIFNNLTSVSSIIIKVNGITVKAPSSSGSETEVISIEPNEAVNLTITSNNGLPYILVPNK